MDVMRQQQQVSTTPIRGAKTHLAHSQRVVLVLLVDVGEVLLSLGNRGAQDMHQVSPICSASTARRHATQHARLRSGRRRTDERFCKSVDRLREPSSWARWDNAFATALLSDARVEERVLTAPLRDRRPAWRGEARGWGRTGSEVHSNGAWWVVPTFREAIVPAARVCASESQQTAHTWRAARV
jgi:hypothetical protein